MTLTRYEIQNDDYTLAADKEEPEALLERASMAGLVGVLRQLGDLAEYAAEVFHCLHEEIMTSATRGHVLAMRLQHLQSAEFPSILSQTDHHSTFFYDPGLEWHSNLQIEENLISPRNLPHCIMDSYKECRAPPQLFLLDKFDAVGPGSCLKRYSDPSLLKTPPTTSAVMSTSIFSKYEKPKKKRSHTTSGETPGDSRISHAKLHRLLLLEHVEKGYRNPDQFLVKLKRRQLLNGPIINSRVHGTLDLSSPAMETEVTVCTLPEDLPIPSLAYPDSGDTRESISERLESCFVNNKSSLANIEALDHAPLKDQLSESLLSIDLIDEENCLDEFTFLHEAPQADPEITPPLPPTQRLMGKLVESVETTETHFSPVAVAGGGNKSFHVYAEESTVEAVSTAAQTTLNEPSEQSPSAVDGTSNDESRPNKRGAVESYGTVSQLTEEAESSQDEWRSEEMALEWFSQNLRDHTNHNFRNLEELDHPRDKDSLHIEIDRSMLRKVSERKRTHVTPRGDENDSLLQIIRSKSFKLRPADASARPNFQVALPITSFKVAAILEKANTLRQAVTGSDDDHDSDSWSE